jgi:phospholipid/cholesterol/gamma-HCH transport system ATP-binding protein
MKKNPVIQVKNLVVRYGDEIILDNINLDVSEGEIVAVLGASGCGKTTLLRHIVGLGRPFSGNVFIDGDEITSDDEDTFRGALRKIGILFQGGALFGSMTLAENVALPIAEYSGLPKNAIAYIVRMKLGLVNLTGFENHFPSEISGGMKKRAALARALALNPKILFLDEPSAGLDPITSAEIDELILSINRRIGTTIVIVTHELDSIFRVARRAVMLDKDVKNIIADGAPEFLKNHSPNPFVKQFFNREAKTGS